ncbi:transposase IS3/IS911 family protein [Paenibacillus larvae subsp. larvae]|uniref:Transposase n=1 Tax=Paenibacillus larvae TaxID=1464 RepID=A0AAP5JVS4_9BACL|nr:transposase [Paenibacillus larvae]AQR77902.1 transposase [Paenibacillus larvae subsp. larvae]AQR79315.1 transposase [Paenibacillus larvae subsp. larvae]AVF20965.1 transposase IS3/IS911 family protein [Paenibacillus larvae subsp. larvae]AVF23518.1 transposase IS3/IS911 family protein [Paenibacillus larvae subsp. larvae]ETK28066.1 transposase IS3/IS911 family protein [Paenibacillus larvae subsp. larvae DSM 25719]
MRRTKYSNEFKVQVVKEALETRNKAAVARRYELASNIESGKWGVISVEGISPLETKKLSQENDHLKRLLGEKDLEITILRDLVKKKNPHLLTKLK